MSHNSSDTLVYVDAMKLAKIETDRVREESRAEILSLERKIFHPSKTKMVKSKHDYSKK